MDFLAAIVEIVSHEVNLCQRLDYNPCVHLLKFYIILDIVLISKNAIMFNNLNWKVFYYRIQYGFNKHSGKRSKFVLDNDNLNRITPELRGITKCFWDFKFSNAMTGVRNTVL